MSTEDQQIRRDVRHTVNVLMASALAERDLANASRVALAARVARHPYAAVAVAVSVAIAIGLGVYVTNLMRERDVLVARLGKQGEIARVKAPAATQGPTKSKPEFVDGKGFAHTGKKLSNRLGDEGAPAAPGNASAAPEERVINDPNALHVRLIPISPGGPQPAPTAAPAVPPGLIAAPAAPPGLIVVPGVTVENMGTPRTQPPPQAPPSAARVQLPPPGPPVKAVQQPPARVASAAEQPPARVASVAEPPPAAAEPAAAAKKAPVVVKSMSGAGFVAVVSSQKSRMDALTVFANMQEKYGTVLASRTADVQEVNLGEKSVRYRLVVGPPGSREAAAGLCAQLKTAGHPDCWVMKY